MFKNLKLFLVMVLLCTGCGDVSPVFWVEKGKLEQALPESQPKTPVSLGDGSWVRAERAIDVHYHKPGFPRDCVSYVNEKNEPRIGQWFGMLLEFDTALSEKSYREGLEDLCAGSRSPVTSEVRVIIDGVTRDMTFKEFKRRLLGR